MKGFDGLSSRGRQGHRSRRSPPREGLGPTARQHGDTVEGGHLPRARGITRRLITASVSCSGNGQSLTRRVLTRVEGFALWRAPRLVLVWLLLTDVTVLCWAVWASTSAQVRWEDTVAFAVLAACATGHVVATRIPEERSFGRQPRGHVDQSSIWLFTAGLTLPVPLIVVLVLVVRIQRYLIARKAPYRFTFSTAAIIASALGVHEVAEVMGLHPWLVGERALPHQLVGQTPLLLGGLAAAVATYFLVQAVIIGIANGLTDMGEARIRARKAPTPSSALPTSPPRIWTLENLLGDKHSNAFILTTLAVAVGATLAQAVSILLLGVFVPIAVRFTKVEQALKQKQAESRHDHLTGLLTRLPFDAAAELELLADRQAGRSSALLFLDIDLFKGWNTDLGHLGGDQVLQALPQVMRAQVRAEDLLCRWGGEEFVIIMPNTTQVEALAAAERIRVGFATMALTIRRPAGGRREVINPRRVEGEGFTISIGVAMAPTHGSGLEELKDVASLAMAAAKKQGRNRVTLAPGTAGRALSEGMPVG